MTLALERVASVADADRDYVRAAFERLDPPEGFKAEMIDGRIILSPTSVLFHAEMLDDLVECFLRDRMPTGTRTPPHPVTISLPDAPGQASYVPDLCVIDRVDRRDRRQWQLDPAEVHLVIEVVSRSSRHEDRELKPKGYASGPVPLYLLIDPLRSEVVLFWDPQEGAYREAHHASFGGKVPFPEPFGGVLDTSIFIR